MTETQSNEPGALFARIGQIVQTRGVDIRQHLSGNSLKLEFADGQRIVVNFNATTRGVWLAAKMGGAEFAFRNGQWHAPEQGELFDRLQKILEQTIASNPINSRVPLVAPEAVAPPEVVFIHTEQPGNATRNIFAVVLIFGLGYWGAQWMNQPPPEHSEIADKPSLTLQRPPAAEVACENQLRGNGDITVFADSGLASDRPNDPAITLENDHAYPLLLILSEPRSAIPALSVLIHARQSAALHLPAGQYDMMFSSGSNWCNPRQGFSDGQMMKYDKPLEVAAEKPMQLSMQSTGAGIGDFQLFVRTHAPAEKIPEPTFSGDGSMEVKRAANGHFYLPGAIAGVPVTFMVDTGASVTSITDDIARQAGVTNCKPVQFQTANGAANGCIALVPRMKLGNFTLQNITVAVMPNMETNLLGANVLRNFQISQSNSEMLIGLR